VVDARARSSDSAALSLPSASIDVSLGGGEPCLLRAELLPREPLPRERRWPPPLGRGGGRHREGRLLLYAGRGAPRRLRSPRRRTRGNTSRSQH
jgi:hypothetical protein